jgi:hypothetical protein
MPNPQLLVKKTLGAAGRVGWWRGGRGGFFENDDSMAGYKRNNNCLAKRSETMHTRKKRMAEKRGRNS